LRTLQRVKNSKEYFFKDRVPKTNFAQYAAASWLIAQLPGMFAANQNRFGCQLTLSQPIESHRLINIILLE